MGKFHLGLGNSARLTRLKKIPDHGSRPETEMGNESMQKFLGSPISQFGNLHLRTLVNPLFSPAQKITEKNPIFFENQFNRCSFQRTNGKKSYENLYFSTIALLMQATTVQIITDTF